MSLIYHDVCVQMLIMKAQVDVICCKSVGTDLSMLDIEDFITEICQAEERGGFTGGKAERKRDKLNREVLTALHFIF